MLKKILLIISLLLAILFSVYLYLYKEHRDIKSESPDFVVTISGLEKEFTSNDSLSSVKYQDKTIELTAQVTDIDTIGNGIVLGEKVFATFKKNVPAEIKSGKILKIKGRFLGYDELLQEFKIDQSSIVY
ncbi:MAG: hypothetical protein ABI441_17210 [Flavobacterium sp.]